MSDNILITSAGRRVSLIRAFKNELKKILPSGKVIVVDSDIELSAAAQIADMAFKIVRANDGAYIDSLLEICLENDVKLVIPTLDTELKVLSRNIDKFRDNQIDIVISDQKFIDTCNDKIENQNFFKKLKIDVVKYFSKDNFKLPLFLKLKEGSNSQENYVISDMNQLSKYHFDNDNLLFFEFLSKDAYDEYTCDLYYGKEGTLKCVIPRKRLEIRGGEISKGITKKNGLVGFVKNKMSNINGARGCITAQFFLNKESGQIIGIEINPRFGGGYPLSYLAGGNFPKWIIKEYIFDEEISYYEDWKDSLLMLRYDDEILIHDFKN
jgi:carbamoyl-phosphate synthase large subunit